MVEGGGERTRRAYVEEGIDVGVREDGRSCGERREVDVTADLELLNGASGSAQARVGTTRAIAAVKPELLERTEDTPMQGKLKCSVEGLGTHDAGRSLFAPLESALQPAPSGQGSPVDLASLVAAGGKAIWEVSVDVVVLEGDGTELAAASLAAAAAAKAAELPKVKESEAGEIELEEGGGGWRVPGALPVCVEMADASGEIVVDPSLEERQVANSIAAIFVARSGEVTGVHMRKGGSRPRELRRMLAMAKRIGVELHEEVDRVARQG